MDHYIVLELTGDGGHWFSAVKVGGGCQVEAGGMSSGGGAWVGVRSVHTDQAEAETEAKRLQAKLEKSWAEERR